MDSIIYVEQDALKLSPNCSTEIEYDRLNDFEIEVEGGSGSGDYYWSIVPVTGLMRSNYGMQYSTHSNVTQLQFKQSGVCILKVYKEGSELSYNYHYSRSKTLEISVRLVGKSIKIVVLPESGVTYPLGYDYDLSDFSISHPDIHEFEYEEVLEPEPELYINQSLKNTENFYRFDVLSKAYGEDRYNNGVRFNNLGFGQWKICGRPSGEARYNLILSEFSVPTYVVPGRTYQLVRKIISQSPYSIPGLSLVYCYETGLTEEQTCPLGESQIVLPKNITGLQVYINVYDQVDGVFEFHIYDIHDRIIDPLKEGEYPVSATRTYIDSNYTSRYNTNLNYRSSRIKYQNNTQYPVNIKQNKGVVVTNLNYTYYPTTDVIFNVAAIGGYYYVDGYDDPSNLYVPTTLNSRSPWDSWWADENTSVCLGSYSSDLNFQFRILGPSIDNGQVSYVQVPFQRLSSKYDFHGRLIGGQYRVKMPVGLENDAGLDIYIAGERNSYSELPSGTAYYWRYDDVEPTTSTLIQGKVTLLDYRYNQAILYCDNAVDAYFGPGRYPLLTSPYAYPESDMSKHFFYKYTYYEGNDVYRNSVNNSATNFIDVFKSLRAILHTYNSYPEYEASVSNSQIFTNPTTYLNEKSQLTNTPNAAVSYYAGYPTNLNPILNSYNIHYPYHGNKVVSTAEYLGVYDKLVALGQLNYMFGSSVDTGSSSTLGSHMSAFSDFVLNAREISDESWASWCGLFNNVFKGFGKEYSSKVDLSYSQCLTILYQFSKFLNMDIPADPSFDASNLEDSGVLVSDEFKSDPACMWALSRRLTTGVHPSWFTGSEVISASPILPTHVVRRFEWAYILKNFCGMYAWR